MVEYGVVQTNPLGRPFREVLLNGLPVGTVYLKTGKFNYFSFYSIGSVHQEWGDSLDKITAFVENACSDMGAQP